MAMKIDVKPESSTIEQNEVKDVEYELTELGDDDDSFAGLEDISED